MTRNNILLCVCVLLIAFTGCQAISQNLDEMSEADYKRTEREIYLITKIASRQFFEAKPELKLQVVAAVDSFGSEIGSYVETGEFLDKLMEKISDPEMKELVELILLEVGKYGGFQYLDAAGEMLNARSAGLLKQVVFGMLDAASEE